MGIIKEVKAPAFINTTVVETGMVVDDGDTDVTFISNGTSVITMEILDLDSFASMELNCRKDLPYLIFAIKKARYETITEPYTVGTTTGFVTVGSSDGKVELAIFKGKDMASARFSPMEAEMLVATLRSCH